MIIRETFACGKPVIASRLGSMAEIVEDNKIGILFEPGNSEDLALKMEWMIELTFKRFFREKREFD